MTVPALGALVVVAAATWVLVVVGRRRYRNRLVHWATRHGFAYRPWDDRLTWLTNGYPFNCGTEDGRHVFVGRRRGRHVIFGEYQGKRGRSLSKYQLVGIELAAECPYLDVSQKTVRSRLSTVFGARGLQLDSPDFNDHFTIDTTADRFAGDVLSLTVMDWLLHDERGRALPWRIQGDWLMTWRYGTLDTTDVLGYLRFLHDLFDQLPDHLWRKE